jgi:hypothetical protein
MAELVLLRATWFIHGVAHRFTELEFYFDGRGHRDPFTHGDAVQRELGRWYHHRAAGRYRGGTYKGMDITFGAPDAAAGILVRGVQRLDDGAHIDGPCRCVDHLLALHGGVSVAAFAASYEGRVDPPPEGESPSYITLDASFREPPTVYASPRVGLTLKRGVTAARVRFLARPYRFLTEPSRARKGRMHLVLGLHRAGVSAREMTALTGVSASQVARYTAWYATGRGRDPGAFARAVTAQEVCQLLGACERFL